MPTHLLDLDDGPSILIKKPILLIGRDAECDVRLNSRKVSRRHCCIAQVNQYLVVRDLGSTNGIRINGARVVEGRVKAGDELVIGGYRYLVCDQPPAAKTPSGAGNRPAARRLPRAAIQADNDGVLEKFDEPVARILC